MYACVYAHSVRFLLLYYVLSPLFIQFEMSEKDIERNTIFIR